MEVLKQRRILMVLIALLFLAYFINLGQLELRSEEPRRAIISIEMMHHQDLLHPKLMGEGYYNKPPIFNWIQVLFYKITGSVSEFASRFPGILSILILGFFLFKNSVRALATEAAIFISFLFFTFADLLFYGLVNSGEIDLFFSFIIFIQIITLYRGYDRESPALAFIGSYLLMTIGFLTKGIPALSFQFFSIVAVSIVFKNYKWLLSKYHFVGALLSLGIILSYFLAFNQQNGSGICYLINLISEAGQRSAAGFDIIVLLKTAAIFPVNLLKLTLPWSFAFLLLFNKKIRQSLLKNQYVRFSLWVLICNLPLYWFTGEIRNRYLYPLFPFMAIGLGQLIYLFYQENIKAKSVSILAKVFLLVMVLGCLALFIVPSFRYIPHIYLVSSIAILSFILMAGMSYAYPRSNIVIIIASILVLKIVFSLTFIPYIDQQSQNYKYREMVKELSLKTNKIPFYYVGNAHIIEPGIASKVKCNLETAPIMAYQLPYYHFISTGKIMEVVPKAELPGYYFCLATAYDKNLGIEISRFSDNINGEYVLFRK